MTKLILIGHLAFGFLTLFITHIISLQVAASELPSLAVINEWQVEWGGRPRDPDVDANGNVWFCGQAGNYIAKLEPNSGTMTRFLLPDNTHPHNLIVDDKGTIWYAGNQNAHIGKLNPKTGSITQFALPNVIEDPHTLVFDDQDNIWFTAQHSNVIGKLNIGTGEVKFLNLTIRNARPYGIVIDHQGWPWVALFGTHHIVSINPETLTSTLHELPRANARPRRIAVSNDGNIWYADYAENMLGRFSPKTKTFTEWSLPAKEDSRPYGMTLDNNNRLWIAETGVYPNKVVVFDLKHSSFIASTTVPSGGAIRHMIYDASRNSIWFGVDTGYVSQLAVNGATVDKPEIQP